MSDICDVGFTAISQPTQWRIQGRVTSPSGGQTLCASRISQWHFATWRVSYGQDNTGIYIYKYMPLVLPSVVSLYSYMFKLSSIKTRYEPATSFAQGHGGVLTPCTPSPHVANSLRYDVAPLRPRALLFCAPCLPASRRLVLPPSLRISRPRRPAAWPRRLHQSVAE